MKSSTKKIIDDLRSLGHPFFRDDNRLILDPKAVGQAVYDETEQLLSYAYANFCFDERVTKRAGLTTFESINEVSSGNNDLGFFGRFTAWSFDYLRSSNYHLSNYSGGRGDFFTLKQLLEIENGYFSEEYYNLENVCLTFGGQGAYSAIAEFLVQQKANPNILLFDSTYCSNYKPFSRKGIELQFVPTTQRSMCPDYDVLLNAAANREFDAMFLVHYQNPGGELIPLGIVQELIEILHRRGKYLVFSEAFGELNFEEDSYRPVEVARYAIKRGYDRLIRVKSLSKEVGLAGLRAGWMFGPADICNFAKNYNDQIAYNVPMVNNPLIVMTSYLFALLRGNERMRSIEEWLGIADPSGFLTEFQEEKNRQQQAIAGNVSRIVAALLDRDTADLRPGCYYENEHFGIIIPKGGINMSVRMKCLDAFDELDVFRKLYLNSGVILHSSKFISKKADFWIRVTLSHSEERLEGVIAALLELANNHRAYDFLPKGSIAITVHDQALSLIQNDNEPTYPKGLVKSTGHNTY